MTAFRNKLVGAACIQASSPVLLLFLALVVSRTQGAAAQGIFATGKSLIDLLVAFGSFGFAQSIIHAIHHSGADRRRLLVYSSLYSLAVLIFIAAMLLTVFPQDLASTFESALLLSFCAVAIIFNNLSRAVLLTVYDGNAFSWHTVLPSVAFFAVFLVASTAGVSIAISFPELSAIVALIVVIGSLIFMFLFADLGPVASVKLPWASLLKNGLDAFIQQVLIVSQTYLSLYLLQKYAVDTRELGWLSVGIMVYQAIGLPLQMVGPMLVNRWVSRDDFSINSTEITRVMLICVRVGVLAIIASPIVFYIIPVIFGTDFSSASSVAAIMFLGAYPILIGRACSTIAVSAGRFRANAQQAALRIFSTMFLCFLFSQFYGLHAWVVAVCWIGAEMISALYISRQMSNITLIPLINLWIGRAKAQESLTQEI
ncbi:hypothetical protein [Limnohabitans sp.]|uniref:lipopolysaccharide biosynthesis protein n=1 Tax=Limnohabitans sp. TaxID=1907725 RepID=UPI00286F7C0A|nr:hypothetical protein [Limnohabitans sp.]